MNDGESGDARSHNDTKCLVTQAFEGATAFSEETGRSGILLEDPPSLDDLEWLSALAELSGPQ